MNSVEVVELRMYDVLLNYNQLDYSTNAMYTLNVTVSPPLTPFTDWPGWNTS